MMKPLSDLTLLDRFLFARVMEDRETMEIVLRIILGRDILLKNPPQTEKEVSTVPWLRAIRLDVVGADMTDSAYNTEVQKQNTGNLKKRSRFYQGLIDSSLLEPGEIDFNRMPAAYLITIAPFDLFGQGKYCYTFQMKCRECDDLWLEDGATRIFLNTRGTNRDEVSGELVELLRYFETTTDEAAGASDSGLIRKIHDQVCKVKSSEEIGVRYMQEWEERAYELREAREEGVEQGLEQGVQEGLSRGIVALIQDNLEEGVSEEKILSKVQRRFSLSGEQARAYYHKAVTETGDL